MAGIMPRGCGWWIAFLGQVTPGPKAVDVQEAVARCLATGATWVALRSGDGGNADADTDEAAIAAFADAGLDVWVWHFNYPGASAAELARMARWAKLRGVRGAILNAEFPYARATVDEARRLVEGARALGFEAVGHAPPDYLGGYGATPSLVELDRICDFVAPQVYAWEHDDRGHLHHLIKVRDLYRARADRGDFAMAKFQPIGCSYRPRVRGEMVDPSGAVDAMGKPRKIARPLPAYPDQAVRVAAEAVAFMDACEAEGFTAPSLYSLDATSWMNGPGDLVIAALTERAAAARTDPGHVPTALEDAAARLVEVPQAVDVVAGLADPDRTE